MLRQFIRRGSTHKKTLRLQYALLSVHVPCPRFVARGCGSMEGGLGHRGGRTAKLHGVLHLILNSETVRPAAFNLMS